MKILIFKIDKFSNSSQARDPKVAALFKVCRQPDAPGGYSHLQMPFMLAMMMMVLLAMLMVLLVMMIMLVMMLIVDNDGDVDDEEKRRGR